MSTITLAEVLDRTDLAAVLLGSVKSVKSTRTVDVGHGPRTRRVISSAAARRKNAHVPKPSEPDIADTIANLFGGDVNVKNLLDLRDVAPQTVTDLTRDVAIGMPRKPKPLGPRKRNRDFDECLTDAERRSNIAALLGIDNINLKGDEA